MYIKLINNKIHSYPYSVAQLRQDNPQISFPEQVSEALLEEFDVYPVQPQPAPTVDHTKTFTEGLPELVDGVWNQTWQVTAVPVEELNQTVANLRKQAYIEEADPLFFKYQRGDATKEEWLAAVNAIKIRYPYAE